MLIKYLSPGLTLEGRMIKSLTGSESLAIYIDNSNLFDKHVESDLLMAELLLSAFTNIDMETRIDIGTCLNSCEDLVISLKNLMASWKSYSSEDGGDDVIYQMIESGKEIDSLIPKVIEGLTALKSYVTENKSNNRLRKKVDIIKAHLRIINFALNKYIYGFLLSGPIDELKLDEATQEE